MYRGNGYCALCFLTDLTAFPLHSTADHGRRHVLLTTSQLAAFPATFSRPKTSGNFLSTKSQPRDRSHLSGTISMASTTHKAAIAAVARMCLAATSSTKTYVSSTTTFSVLTTSKPRIWIRSNASCLRWSWNASKALARLWTTYRARRQASTWRISRSTTSLAKRAIRTICTDTLPQVRALL